MVGGEGERVVGEAERKRDGEWKEGEMVLGMGGRKGGGEGRRKGGGEEEWRGWEEMRNGMGLREGGSVGEGRGGREGGVVWLGGRKYGGGEGGLSEEGL